MPKSSFRTELSALPPLYDPAIEAQFPPVEGHSHRAKVKESADPDLIRAFRQKSSY